MDEEQVIITEESSDTEITLFEILLTAIIIAVIFVIVAFAANPNSRGAGTRNAQRQTDVLLIINAVHQYSINEGSVPESISTVPTEICQARGACSGFVDLNILIAEGYLKNLPEDPHCPELCADNGIGYKIAQAANGRVMVTAPNAEQSLNIMVMR
jgi:competence protein ComGC